MKRRLRSHTSGVGQRVRWFTLLAGVLMGLCVFAPARWLTIGLEQATQGRVRLPNASGTVWQGRADLLLSGGTGSAGAQALPQGLHWTLRPDWGPQGPGLTLTLQAPCCTVQAMTWQLAWAPGGPQLSLAAHRSDWPAPLLAGLGAPWNTLALEGRLQLQSQGLTLRPHAGGLSVSGALQIEAQDLSTRLSTLRPLGSYHFELSASSDHALALRLDTVHGDLRLSGTGEWLQGRLRFRGLAEAAPEHVDALSNLLNILGRRDGPRAHMSLG